MSIMQVLVIGCGVIGLSTAITLLKQTGGKFKVTIVAKDLPPNTTSNKAAAVWFPFLAYPADKIGRWANYTLGYLREEAQKPQSGVLVRKTVEIFTEVHPEPEWKVYVPSLTKIEPADLPQGFTHGFAIEGAVADTDLYMEYLVQEFISLGGKIIQKEIKDISEAFATHSVVINCTGLGARELVKDESIYPTRGQTVIVKNKKLVHAIMHDGTKPEDLAYVVPRTSTTVLGGTSQVNNWNTQPDDADTRDILRKCAQLNPEFSKVDIVQIKVGLRPTRPTVRLEAEWFQEGKLLVHNYGHGGSGFTIGWGCALEVLSILEQKLLKHSSNKL